MKVVRLKRLLLAIFVSIFSRYVLFCIVFLFFVFVCFGFFFCLFFFLAEGGAEQRNIFLTKIAHLKLPFYSQFKYMSFVYQQHMRDLLVLFLPQRISRETVACVGCMCRMFRFLFFFSRKGTQERPFL